MKKERKLSLSCLSRENKAIVLKIEHYLETRGINDVSGEEVISDIIGMALECQERGDSFEEMIDSVAKNGYECVEVACWPQGKAARRYAGVSHIDVDNTTAEYIDYVKTYCADAVAKLFFERNFVHTVPPL